MQLWDARPIEDGLDRVQFCGENASDDNVNLVGDRLVGGVQRHLRIAAVVVGDDFDWVTADSTRKRFLRTLDRFGVGVCCVCSGQRQQYPDTDRRRITACSTAS